MNLRAALVLLISGLGMTTQPSLAEPITFSVTLFDVPGSTATTAIGINNAGQIVGSYTDGTGTHGFLDTNGTFTTLNFPGSTFTQATGINNVGQIVGFYSGGAFLYQNGTFSNLNIPAATLSGPFGIPQQVAINDSGQIVGTTNDGRGFLYANGQLTFLPTSMYPATAAMGINNAGDIAGSVRDPFFLGGYAVVYRNGQYIGLPTDNESAAYGINNAGDVVVNNGTGPSTCLISQNISGCLPPVLPHETLFGGIGRGLNDSDQIVGSYAGSHGFLATPVPEPASVLLLASGLVGVGLLLRRKTHKPLYK